MPSPSGRKLDDGHPTTITFAYNTTIGLWEKTVKPPGVSGGEPVDIDTMRNTTYNTVNPRHLKRLTAMSGNCAYDEGQLAAIITLVNRPTAVTITFPNGRPWTFFGFLQSFEPAELAEGVQPTATYSIVPTMQDPATGVETGPTIGNTTATTTP